MDLGNVKTVSIVEEMTGAYLDYSMSVIVSRALPDGQYIAACYTLWIKWAYNPQNRFASAPVQSVKF